jgi:hypothetical protein
MRGDKSQRRKRLVVETTSSWWGKRLRPPLSGVVLVVRDVIQTRVNGEESESSRDVTFDALERIRGKLR